MKIEYTDTQLKQALAKMLPEKVEIDPSGESLFWKEEVSYEVLDTELLHLCWLVEETLTPEQLSAVVCEIHSMHIGTGSYFTFDSALYHATWQQRTIALCKVKGVGIV